jgi:hypothetical protein
MRTIRWAMSLTIMLASLPALGDSAVGRWGHDDTPYADEVAGSAATESPGLGLDVLESAPNAAESGAFIDAWRGTSNAPSASPSADVRYATPGTPFATELGIPLA